MGKKKVRSKIVIDPGHGGPDPGAVNVELGIKESELALQYGLMLHSRLYADLYEILMTRERDIFIPLRERVKMAQKFKADLFISLHMNSAENPLARGFEVWTSVGKTRADEIATSIFENIADEFPSRKPRADWSDMPAVLVELGFICNNEEAIWLTKPSTMLSYARAIINGIWTKT
jgi:N-acetylmuramoyl-L-alanine amidase